MDLAVSYEGQVDLSAAEGLNVKAVGWIVPVPLASLIAKADGTVAGVEDLRGKTVGWPGIPSFGAMTEAVLEHADIPENEVELVNVGYNLVQSVMSGQVDAIIGGFRNSEAVNLAEVSGTEPVVIPVDQLGVPSYNELVFVADGARLADDADYRDRVQRFLAAYYSALDEVQADPDQAIEVLSNYMEASRENVTSAVRMTVGLMKPPNGLPAGCISTEQWGAFADWMAEHELISRAPSPEQTLDLSLLPEDCA